MTTTDRLDPVPAAPPPDGSPPRALRRSRGGRVGAGVAAGLGNYFGLDPVLFRVLFATSAFFGGAGILAYLLAWAAIPDEGTARAPIDAWVGELRRRRFPLWLAAFAAAALFWLIAFSWWAPGPFLPVLAFLLVTVFVVTRRGLRPVAEPSDQPVDLTKTATAVERPAWVREGRSWFAEARAAGRARRRRSWPIRIGVLTALVLSCTTLGVLDAVSGVQLRAYVWTGFGIVLAGLLAGLVTRRFAVSLLFLLVPWTVLAIAFAGTRASLHDGIGQRVWKPAGAPAASYRLGIGQGVLDLRALAPQTAPRHIDVTVAAGRVLIIAPRTMNATVQAAVHFGDVQLGSAHSSESRGIGIERTIEAPGGATGMPIAIDVHLADGNVTVDRR